MTHEEVFKALLDELHALNEREDRTRDTLESMCIDLAVSGIGSVLNHMRCLKTLVAAGGDRHNLRRVVDGYLRKSIVADAVLMVDLERVPVREPEMEPFEATLRFMDQLSEDIRIRMAAPRDVRVTTEEAAAGCVLQVRLDGKPVEVTIPPGVRDGDIFTTQGEGRSFQIVLSVAASPFTAASQHASRRPRTPTSTEMV
jgi:hypothetical protein